MRTISVVGVLLAGWCASGTALAGQMADSTNALSFSLPTALAATGTNVRKVLVDASPFGGRSEQEWVTYDLDAVLKPITSRRMAELPDWAVAVRLVLSEVGADRLLANRYGLVEAMGVIETVFNRLDVDAWNPLAIRGIGGWPGCGEGATFASCANPQQYYGMSRDRALNPSAAYGRREMLLQAIDRAVVAWWLVDTDMVPDVTEGATSFHHACGGAAYGADPSRCGGSSTVTGPVIFKGPGRWLGSAGRYETVVKRQVDYRPGVGADTSEGWMGRYLWGERGGDWEEGDFVTPWDELERLWDDGVVSSAAELGPLVR